MFNAKLIVFNANFLVSDTQFLAFDTKLIVFDTKLITCEVVGCAPRIKRGTLCLFIFIKPSFVSIKFIISSSKSSF